MELLAINGIAAIMPGAIADIVNHLLAFLHQLQKPPGQCQILPLIAAANIIDLTHPALMQHGIDGPAIIQNIDPVSYICPISINGYLFAF